MASRDEVTIDLAVETRPREGHAEDEPYAIAIAGRRIEVQCVLDRWLAVDHRYFKLLGADGHTYVIRHDVPGRRWELTVFNR